MGHCTLRGSQNGKRERKKGPERLFKGIRTDNFSNPGKETAIQIQETETFPNKMKLKIHMPRNVKSKSSKLKDQERVIQAAKVKQHFMYKETLIRLVCRFFSRKFADQKGVWIYITSTGKRKEKKDQKLQPKIYYLAW